MKHIFSKSLRRAMVFSLLIVAQSSLSLASASTRNDAAVSANAANGSFTIVITGNSVIGRDGPNGVDMGYRFNRGQRLTCVGASGSWYQCRIDGRYVWVSSAYAKRVGTATNNNAYNNGTVVITGDRVIGRSTPGGADTGKRFYKGQRVGYRGSNGSWLCVVSGGRTYWVSRQYAYIQ